MAPVVAREEGTLTRDAQGDEREADGEKRNPGRRSELPARSA
jgi:hypothetical protein